MFFILPLREDRRAQRFEEGCVSEVNSSSKLLAQLRSSLKGRIKYRGLLRNFPMIKKYLQLTKPGIVLGNLISATGGFLLAAHGNFFWKLFFVTMTGTALVIASACIFNNYIDRDIDAKMQRTCKRIIPPKIILLYASLIFLAGIFVLYFLVNPLSAILAFSGFIIYVGIYSLCLKRHSIFATLVGSLSGAIPPVIGYVAITNNFDLGAFLLMLIFILWQMPHSYALGILYLNDYSKAKIPLLPVQLAKVHIIFYIAALIVAEAMLTISGYTGYAYLIIVSLIGIYWLYTALSKAENQLWARKIFIISIVNITLVSFMMALNN